MITKDQKRKRRLSQRTIAKEKAYAASSRNDRKDSHSFLDKEHLENGEKIEGNQSAEFLLKEYERLNLLRMDEVKQSEQRVTFFLTIASAAIGLIVVLAQTSSFTTDKILVISRVALIILLLFGLNILNRMNARIVQLRTIDKLMAEIRAYFRKSHPEIAAYFQKYDKLFQSPIYRFNITTHVLRRLRGALIDLIVLSNSLICGGIAFIEFYSRGYRDNLIIVLTVATVIGATTLLYMYYYFFMKRLPPFG
jgi:uncharacterized membrane protein